MFTVAMPPLLEIKNIGKRFGDIAILEDVDLALFSGQICGLLGENGAGKSALIRILAGASSVDTGEIRVDGQPVSLDSRQALTLGIHSVLHENNLVGDMSVADNLLLRREIKCRLLPFIRNGEVIRRARGLLREFGLDLDPGRPARTLTPAEGKMLEICRAFAFSPRLVILDDPGLALGRAELENVFRHIARSRDRGVGIVYTSHTVRDILHIADRVIVMNRGEITGDLAPGPGLDRHEIVRRMVDGNAGNRYPRLRNARGPAMFTIHNLSSRSGNLRNISFSLYKGEIAGVLGLSADEISAFARLLFSLDVPGSGYVAAGARILNSPGLARKAGIAYVGNDVENSVFANLGLTENVTLLSGRAGGRKFRRGPFLRLEQLEFAARYAMRQCKMRLGREPARPSELNRVELQKLVLARWILADSGLYIMNDPTKQLGIPAKLELYNTMRNLADNGKTVLLLSSDINEVAGMCDRAIIMNDGAVAHIAEGEALTPNALVEYVCGEAENVPPPRVSAG